MNINLKLYFLVLFFLISGNNIIYSKPLNDFSKKNQIGFIENLGQIKDFNDNPATNVTFLLQKGNTKIFLLKNGGIAYQIENYIYPEGYADAVQESRNMSTILKGEDKLKELSDQIRIETFRTDMELVGVNINPIITTEGKSSDYINYYNKGATDVHHYEKVIYHNIYPGIDWVIYTNQEGLKYDFVVHPGANPSLIKMKYSYQEQLELTEHNDLLIKTKLGDIQEVHPTAFQNNYTPTIQFSKKKNTIGFNIKKYDPTQTLVIDPLVRVWGTYYGGSLADDGTSTVVDISGNIYLTGSTSSTNAISAGGYQIINGGNSDAYEVKFNNAGIRQWATYYGGQEVEDCISIAADKFGSTFIGGTLLKSNQDQDVFLVKFDSVGYLVWDKIFGGQSPNGGPKDERGGCVATDNAGNVYITGTTRSTNNISFNGFQNSIFNGTGSATPMHDAFLAKFDSSGSLIWSTYYGGTYDESGVSIATDYFDNVYLAGITQSSNNIAFNPAWVTTANPGIQTFLVKFNSNGNRIWATYGYSFFLRIVGNGESNRIALDSLGNIYLAGYSNQSSGISYNGFQNIYGGNEDAVLVKLNNSGTLQWATYYGGPGIESGEGVTTDRFGNVYLAGRTQSQTAIDSSGYQDTLCGSQDAFLVKFDSSGQRIWGTYYGGASDEHGESVSVSNKGEIYLAGFTSSSNGIYFLGHQSNLGGVGPDAFLVKFYDFSVAPPSTQFSLSDTSLCSGTCVNFTNQSTRDSSWLWLFPGGTPASSTLQTPPQVCYNTPGTYSVTLITSNSFGADTLTLPNYITVDPSPIAQINSSISACKGSTINLTSSGGTSYSWTGPNGFTSNLQNPTINNSVVTNSGTYSVVVANSAGCTDTATTQITIHSISPAVANSNSPLCAGQTLNLTANAASTYSWSGPNGFTSSLQNPTIPAINNNGSGTYTLIVSNNFGCKDTTTLSVNVLANNVVTVNSNGPLCTGQTLNLSASNGSSYAWSGPNGFTSSLQNPTINNVVVNNAGSYSVVVTNSNGCTNSASLTVSINQNTPVTANSNSPVCEGDNITLSASAGTSYSWTGPNGFTSSIQNPIITNISTTSSGLYSVTVTNACGTGSSNTQVQVGQKPTAAIAVTQTVICEGDTVYLTADGGTSYYWYGPNGFNSILSNPTVTNFSSANAGAYYLVANNASNCSDTTVVNLALNESTCFFIPSVFTPNNDGTNDTWIIEGMWQFPNCVVKVYNRWGQSLFESKGYATPWDGTFEGNDCPIADYYYIIDLHNGSKVFTGTITIKR